MIETERLRCETVTAAHADAMYPVLSDPRIYEYLPDQPPASVEALRRRYELLSRGTSPDGSEHWLNWMLFLRESGEPIGFVQATVRPASCSFAYVLNPRHWRKGYATEACTAVVSNLFERYGVASVRAEVNARNEASLALVRGLGFASVRHDAVEGDDVYEVTRADWDRRHPRR